MLEDRLTHNCPTFHLGTAMQVLLALRGVVAASPTLWCVRHSAANIQVCAAQIMCVHLPRRASEWGMLLPGHELKHPHIWIFFPKELRGSRLQIIWVVPMSRVWQLIVLNSLFWMVWWGWPTDGGNDICMPVKGPGGWWWLRRMYLDSVRPEHDTMIWNEGWRLCWDGVGFLHGSPMLMLTASVLQV